MFTHTGQKLLRDKVESPDYVRENCLDLDLLYYYESQVRNPTEELFSLLLHPEPFEPLGKSNLWKIFHKQQTSKEYHQHNKRTGQNEITQYFSKRVRSNMLQEQKENEENLRTGKIKTPKQASVFDNMPSVIFSKMV